MALRQTRKGADEEVRPLLPHDEAPHEENAVPVLLPQIGFAGRLDHIGDGCDGDAGHAGLHGLPIGGEQHVDRRRPGEGVPLLGEVIPPPGGEVISEGRHDGDGDLLGEDLRGGERLEGHDDLPAEGHGRRSKVRQPVAVLPLALPPPHGVLPPDEAAHLPGELVQPGPRAPAEIAERHPLIQGVPELPLSPVIHRQEHLMAPGDQGIGHLAEGFLQSPCNARYIVKIRQNDAHGSSFRPLRALSIHREHCTPHRITWQSLKI